MRGFKRRRPFQDKPLVDPERPNGNVAGDHAQSKRMLITEDAAAYLGLSVQALAKMRWSGDSPAFFKVGRRVLYDRDELETWLAKRKRRSTSDAGKDLA